MEVFSEVEGLLSCPHLLTIPRREAVMDPRKIATKIRQFATFISLTVQNHVNLTSYFHITFSLEKFVKLKHSLAK